MRGICSHPSYRQLREGFFFSRFDTLSVETLRRLERRGAKLNDEVARRVPQIAIQDVVVGVRVVKVGDLSGAACVIVRSVWDH